MDDDIEMTMDEAYRIHAAVDRYSDEPDGAFWALLEEEGIYPEDVDAAQAYLDAQGL